MDNEVLREQVYKLVVARADKKELSREDLEPHIDRAIYEASTYCRRHILPQDMRYVVADMASDIYDMFNFVGSFKQGEAPAKEVKTIRQGDTTLEFNTATTPQTFTSITEITNHYKSQLIPYRAIYWR